MSRTSGIAATAVTVGTVFLLGSPSALASAPVLPLPGGPGVSGAPWAHLPFGRFIGPVFIGPAEEQRAAGSSDAVAQGRGQVLGAGLELPVAAVRVAPAVERPAGVIGTTTGARMGRPPSTQRLVTAVVLAVGTALAVVFLNRRRPVARG